MRVRMIKVVPKGGSIPLNSLPLFFLHFNRNHADTRYRNNRIDAIEVTDRTDDRQSFDTLVIGGYLSVRGRVGVSGYVE